MTHLGGPQRVVGIRFLLGSWGHLERHAATDRGFIDVGVVVNEILVLTEVVAILATHARYVLFLEVVLDSVVPGDVGCGYDRLGVAPVVGSEDLELTAGEEGVLPVVWGDDGGQRDLARGGLRELPPGAVEGVTHATRVRIGLVLVVSTAEADRRGRGVICV